MTTTVKVHVNGNYITTVRTTDRRTGSVTEREIDATGKNGGVEEVISIPHPVDADIHISERYAGEKQTEGLSETSFAGEVKSSDQQTEHREAPDVGANKKPNMFD